MDLGLKGKVAVITGSSTGIGAGTAKVLAAEGCNVVVNYFSSPAKAEEVVKEITEKYGVKAIAVQADAGNEEDIIRLFKTAVDEFGTVDILMNNALDKTSMKRGPFETFELESLRSSERVNVEGMFLCSREFVKICKEHHHGGKIVNVVSKSMYWSSSIMNEVYASTKGAVSAFTRALAHEVGEDGIYVNAIIPGYCKNSGFDPESERVKKTMELIPLGRYAEPEEMGYTVAYLCSDKALQINGHTVDCTGGTLVGDRVKKAETNYNNGFWGKAVKM